MFYSFLSQWGWWQRAEVLALQGAEAESSQVSGLPELQSELKIMLDTLVKACLKTKSENGGEDGAPWLSAYLRCEALSTIPGIWNKNNQLPYHPFPVSQFLHVGYKFHLYPMTTSLGTNLYLSLLYLP